MLDFQNSLLEIFLHISPQNLNLHVSVFISHTRTVLTFLFFQKGTSVFLNRMCFHGSAPSNDHPTSVVTGCHCRVFGNAISHL